MRRLFIYTMLLFFMITSCKTETTEQPQHTVEKAYEEISFITPDSITIFGQLYATSKSDDCILLFHQGGSNARGEYRTIIPRLQELGLNILAIDQRVGGQIYGNYNRTIANIPNNSFNNNYGYCDAYNNLEGALDFLIREGYSGRKIAWGSSYSASLSLKLATKRPDDLIGVLAFSPAAGEVMNGCNPEPYFEDINIPAIILKPPNEMESDRSKEQFELAAKYNIQTYAAEYGRHGSSMLVESRVGHDVTNNWEVVLTFIENVRKR